VRGKEEGGWRVGGWRVGGRVEKEGGGWRMEEGGRRVERERAGEDGGRPVGRW
jgi:hypothetical protein